MTIEEDREKIRKLVRTGDSFAAAGDVNQLLRKLDPFEALCWRVLGDYDPLLVSFDWLCVPRTEKVLNFLEASTGSMGILWPTLPVVSNQKLSADNSTFYENPSVPVDEWMKPENRDWLKGFCSFPSWNSQRHVILDSGWSTESLLKLLPESSWIKLRDTQEISSAIFGLKSILGFGHWAILGGIGGREIPMWVFVPGEGYRGRKLIPRLAEHVQGEGYEIGFFGIDGGKPLYL
jgi:hypothetical protein